MYCIMLFLSDMFAGFGATRPSPSPLTQVYDLLPLASSQLMADTVKPVTKQPVIEVTTEGRLALHG